MKCANCGAAALVHDKRDIPFTYKGEQVVIPGVTGDFCPACGEIFMDPEQSRRYMAATRSAREDINKAQVDKVYIRAVRKKLKLRQADAGAIFGGGANAFSRYERGIARPPVSLVKLLHVLERHPELLKEVREAV